MASPLPTFECRSPHVSIRACSPSHRIIDDENQPSSTFDGRRTEDGLCDGGAQALRLTQEDFLTAIDLRSVVCFVAWLTVLLCVAQKYCNQSKAKHSNDPSREVDRFGSPLLL